MTLAPTWAWAYWLDNLGRVFGIFYFIWKFSILLGFVYFVIKPLALSANRVDWAFLLHKFLFYRFPFWDYFFLFHKLSNFFPPPPRDAGATELAKHMIYMRTGEGDNIFKIVWRVYTLGKPWLPPRFRAFSWPFLPLQPRYLKDYVLGFNSVWKKTKCLISIFYRSLSK